MSSFVTRPFLRRSGSSTSSLLKDTGSPDSASATRLSRSRSYSTSTTSSAVALPHPNIFRGQGRSQSFSSTITAGSDDDPIPTGSIVEVRPGMREVARHPGCIEEDVIEEEAVNDTEIDLPPNPQRCDHRAQQLPTTITEEPSDITTITSSSSSVLPIQDCCEACTRNTLLGMNEDYIPPFSESAIRKIQREREEHEQNMQVVADAAAAAGAAVAAGTTMEEEEEDDVQPKRIWNGKEWVLETSELPSSEQTSSKRSSAVYEHGDAEVDMDNASRPTSSGTSGSRRGSGLFDTDKAISMMVDEVEYVRRMRGQASSSSLRPEEVGNWVEVGQKRAERGIREKDGHALREIPSPDHGVWITSKPTSPIRSPRKSPRVEGTTDYLSAKPTYSAPSHPTSSTSASTPQTPSFHRTESDDREADAQLVRQALQQEAEATRNARTTTTSSEKAGGSHNISEAPPTSPTATEPRRKKWYKIPLPSPLAV
ncbi:hypothetical protein QFC21_003369 [Naganishia friedmannii]|uniref:Uncharacterized protein n=1 Tax=Naganishia friedmannii TaxID=89922 RepID=A0ACC2VPV4_9TREE|nr:hypothetical protein QFC21_003369 [Naganishia friedmannii]